MKLAMPQNLLLVLIVAVSAAIVQAAPKTIKNVLHFTKVAGYNHKDGIIGCTKALDNLAAQQGFTVKHTNKEGDILSINEYDVVVFDNNVADKGGQGLLPTDDQQKALVDYLEGGGAFLGFHGATDFDCHGWEWFHLTLFSGNCFKGHDKDPKLELDPDLTKDPQLSRMWEDGNLGNTVAFKGTELYKFKGSTKNLRDDPDAKVLQKATKDGQSYDDHYFTWTKPIGEGRMLYTGLGHGASDFTQNDNWLEKATWYWMKYLVGQYGEVAGCMVKGDPNYDSTATIPCDTCCAPCCKTPGFVETNISNCNNPVETECKTASVGRVALNPSLVEISSEKISVAYPNPYRVRVLNVNGETVIAESSRGMNEYSLSGLQAGLYFVKVVSEGKSVSQRILVH